MSTTNLQQNRDDWLTLVPHGQFVTRQWLLAQGVTLHAFDNAVKSAKLMPLARGVYTRSDVPVAWQGVSASLNRVLDGPVYVGGLSALAQHGLAHYISFSTVIELYSPLPVPSWLGRLKIATSINWHSTTRIWDTSALLKSGSLKTISIHQGEWLLASPEQAFLEVLALVPSTISFEQADNIMQGLVNLSPRRLDSLLKSCKHVQVKRLFFFFADRYQHAWRQKLHAEDYDLGAGKRSIVADGKLDTTYNITVPEIFHG